METDNALEKLFELVVRLGDEIERGLLERGLTRARAEVLWFLHHQRPMTQHALSQALRCTPRNVTGLVDALEVAGFVARGPHPSDRRATLVSLTERGAVSVAAMNADYQKLAAFLFADLSANDVGSFVMVLDQVLGRLGNFRGLGDVLNVEHFSE